MWDLLEPVQEQFGSSLSMSDLIVLAGTTALDLAGGLSLPFCTAGRVDLLSPDEGWKHLQPRVRSLELHTPLIALTLTLQREVQ